jgi:hypothetical protein
MAGSQPKIGAELKGRNSWLCLFRAGLRGLRDSESHSCRPLSYPVVLQCRLDGISEEENAPNDSAEGPEGSNHSPKSQGKATVRALERPPGNVAARYSGWRADLAGLSHLVLTGNAAEQQVTQMDAEFRMNADCAGLLILLENSP